MDSIRENIDVGGVGWITIGNVTIREAINGRVWLERDSGEGMECKEDALLAVLEQFYVENF